LARWPALKGDKREEVLNEAVKHISGIGGIYSGDYISIFYKKHGDLTFYIVKYGCRTIYERSWDEEWYEVYNWNAVLLLEKPDGSYELVDEIIFEVYEEVNKTIERWFNEYPEKYFQPDEDEEEDFEFPDWAKEIVSTALMKVNKGNIEEIKGGLASTALCLDNKLLEKAYELLELKVKTFYGS